MSDLTARREFLGRVAATVAAAGLSTALPSTLGAENVSDFGRSDAALDAALPLIRAGGDEADILAAMQGAIFAGGGRATSIAWHKIAEILQTDRDVLLVLHDRETAHRFRFNSFAEALCGAALSRHLMRRARQRTAGL